MFVDTAKVELHAGKGGDGAVSFRHEIYIPKGGPDGGDGGKGGSIVFKADKDTNTLLDFRYNPILRAENGRNGAGQRAAGRSGRDLVVEVPIGTVVYRSRSDALRDPAGSEPEASESDGQYGATVPWDAEDQRSTGSRELIADLVEDGQTAIIARGGDGGFGNAHFKSSTRQTPRIAEVGEPGEEFEAELELKLLADVGLVGLPNAGKSTFLSVVSNAKPEIADYPFTTLTPNLGVAEIDGKDLLIADIPGLIEGASEGKGLGHAFLRHVDRTAVLLHLVDAYNDDAGAAYATIRHELEKYSDLKNRPEIVALTKTEGLDPEIVKMQTASILAKNPSAKVYAISSAAHQGLTELLRALRTEVDNGKALADSRTSALESPAGSEPKAIPVISLGPDAVKDIWTVEKDGDKFVVRGEKIEKFARRTDLSNYASVNRLRDIMKKMGIRGELTTQGAEPDSIISIAGKEFTFVEEGWQ
ncbi:GTPase ObgE [Candidatus Saccharibacteria bacterium]|nr:GTPase ObgE [Candidatus Saccharibacteria bacterium]